MDGKFRSMIAQETRPITLGAIQKMRNNGLFRNLGEETTSNRISIRLNPGTSSVDGTICAALIPGIQGVASNEWHAFGAKLTIPTYLIPLTKTKNATTIEAIAESIIITVTNCFAQQKRFYLIGYSFGAVVALQLAQLLERSGKYGRVVLIDGSPIYLQKFFASMSASGAKKANEDMLFMLLYFNLTRTDQTYDFIDQLQNAESLQKKIDLLLRYFPDSLKSLYSVQYLVDVITAMANRLNIITQANVNDDTKQFAKLKSLVTLIRPAQASIPDIANDYHLSKYTEQSVDLRVVDGNYLKMLNSNEVAEIINQAAPTE